MKISIITPCYNSRATIGETIQSVASQTHPDIEYIIVDGGSTDNTVEIINKYKGTVDILISEEDDGIYNAMNKGIRMASGDVIGILNSDDMYHSEDVISNVASELEQSGTDAVYGDLQYVNQEGTKVLRNWKAGVFKRSKFKRGWMPPHPTFFVKRKVYERYGSFNEEFRIAADYELMLRLLYSHGISVSYIPEVLVRMKTGGASNSSISNRLTVIKEDYLAWKKNGLDSRIRTQVLKRLTKFHQFIPMLRGS